MPVTRGVRVPAFLVAGASLFMSSSASGTPRPLPFTYNYETLGEGELEVEQYVDLDPIRVPSLQNGVAGPIWSRG
jgi:hypothetical protein